MNYVSQVDERIPRGAMSAQPSYRVGANSSGGTKSRSCLSDIVLRDDGCGLGASIQGYVAQSDYESSHNAVDVDLRETANARYAQANAFFVTSGMIWLAAMVDSRSSGRTVRIDPDLYQESME